MASRPGSFVRSVGRLVALASTLVACGQAEGHRLGGTLVTDGDPIIDSDKSATLRVGRCGSGADLELIDDMEDGKQAILRTANRAGSWFAFNDLTGEQKPQAGSSIFPMTELVPPRQKSTFAAHASGQNFTGWGAGIGFELAATSEYDARSYGGVAFWARVESGSTLDFRFNVTDVNTSQYGGLCDLDCQPDVGPMRPDEPTDGLCGASAYPCFDDFGADLLGKLSDQWQLFTFRWKDLKAKDWSNQALPGLTVSALYGVRFQANGPRAGEEAMSFDVWIDDVSLLCY